MMHNWVPNVVYVGRDTDLEKKISSAFVGEVLYRSCRSTLVADKFINQWRHDVIIFDEEILTTEAQEQRPSASLEKYYEDAILENPKVIFVVLYKKFTTYFKNFQKRNVSTLLYDREKLSASRLSYALEFLKRQTFRSVHINDIIAGKEYPVNFYRLRSEQQDYELCLDAYTKIDKSELGQLKGQGHTYLFVENKDFYQLFGSAEIFLPLSEKMHLIRKRYKGLLTEMIDDSYLGLIHNGKKLETIAFKIVDELSKLIDKFENPYEAIHNLPFIRATLLAHGINNCIYALAFSKVCFSDYQKEMAYGALIHDIGLSMIDFHLIKKNKGKHSIQDRISYEGHVKYTEGMAINKMFPLSKISKEFVLNHHEACDGSGFPKGKEGKELSLESRLAMICDQFDTIRLSGDGKGFKTPLEVIQMLKDKFVSTSNGSRLDAKLLKALGDYFERCNAKKKAA